MLFNFFGLLFQCPDKPNVTNNIVCSSCGAAGHIAKDCRQKRPGLGGAPMSGDKAKIDEEYMSLMAELGEGPPPEFIRNTANNVTSTNTPTQRKNVMNLFDPQMAPRPLMPPPPPMATNMMTGMSNPMNSIPPPPWPPAPNMTWQPGPPGIMPPPPPPGASSPPQMMPWMSTNAQPPPPGASNTSIMPPTMPPWSQPSFQWPPNNCAPPPPPGIDVTALLTAPPPPPPSSA